MVHLNTLTKRIYRFNTAHRIRFQLGLIVVLVLFITLFQSENEADPKPKGESEVIEYIEHDRIQPGDYEYAEIVVIQNPEYRPADVSEPPPEAPSAPEVGISKPDDDLIEDFDMDLITDSELQPDLHYLDLPLQTIDSGPNYFLAAHVMPDLKNGTIHDFYRDVVYPDEARQEGIEGKVFLQFIVNENGEVEEPTILRGIGGGCDEAAMDALQDALFTPGKIEGEPVRVKIGLAVKFELNRLTGLPEIMLTESGFF